MEKICEQISEASVDEFGKVKPNLIAVADYRAFFAKSWI